MSHFDWTIFRPFRLPAFIVGLYLVTSGKTLIIINDLLFRVCSQPRYCYFYLILWLLFRPSGMSRFSWTVFRPSRPTCHFHWTMFRLFYELYLDHQEVPFWRTLFVGRFVLFSSTPTQSFSSYLWWKQEGRYMVNF